MIKKINIALAAAFVALFLLKTVISLVGGARAHKTASDGPVTAEVRNAEFAPNVYFMVYPPYFWPNPLTKRNGYVNDIVTAVFPNAKLVQISVVTKEGYVEKLMSDPHAVVVYTGHPRLMEFPHSDVSLPDLDICLTTLRTSEWRYEGPESLKKIKIGLCADDAEDSELIREYCRTFKDDPAKLKLYTSTVSADIMNRELDNEVIDAFLSVRLPTRFVMNSSNARTIVRYRLSDAVDTIPLRLFVSNLDPDWSAALLDAYARGMKEIEASGELRRIREYYGIGEE